MPETKVCCKCLSESFNGKYISGKWYCSVCIEYCNISEADDYGGTKLAEACNGK